MPSMQPSSYHFLCPTRTP
uniref:Uncharacterized protein n=1 Tax=Arundo donax TaxID=35708 RepID=A0A0A9AE42_ARUDO